MSRFPIFSTAALAAVLVLACHSAADDQAKADKAQAVATDKLTSATVEANEKIASAQAQADKELAEAHANFVRLREDYRHDVTTELVNLDERVAKAAAKGQTLNGHARAELDTKLTQVRSARDAVAADYEQLQAATAITWDDEKARVDKDMTAFKTLVGDL